MPFVTSIENLSILLSHLHAGFAYVYFAINAKIDNFYSSMHMLSINYAVELLLVKTFFHSRKLTFT